MTLDDMVRTISANIEQAREAMDKPPCGYVLHTEDFTLFLQFDDDGKMSLGWPPSRSVLVERSLPRARTLQRYVASKNATPPLKISLRGEALAEYVNGQIDLLDLLIGNTKGAA